VTRAAQQAAEQAERFARYTELRDGGAYPADAAIEIAVTVSTGQRYERAYRQARGQPRREPGRPDTAMRGTGGWIR
jgi:hypothetical protein